MLRLPCLFVLSCLLIPATVAVCNAAPADFQFHFGPGHSAWTHTHDIAPTLAYSDARGYGFEGPAGIREAANCVTSDTPFFFSVKLAEGNYNVEVELGGDGPRGSDTTVKAELRRLMLQDVRTKGSQTVTRTFTVNVRTPQIAGDGQVHLKKPRETTDEAWAWDDKLTLEFNGSHPCLRSIGITKVDVPTVFLLGDSTVCDQAKEPWNSWGQMLTRFFKPGVAVSNQAESGETLRGALHAGRVAKVLGDMKKGDYLLIQFGHNDMKEKGAGVGAFTTYKADLEKVVNDVRQHGGTPVLVSSMNRKSFDATGHVYNTLKDYPDAVRAVAREMNAPLIDLNAVSKTLYEAIGKKNIDKAFVDGTHHNAYGSYEMARCVIEGIRQDKLELAKFVVDDVPPFDPAHPDPIDTFRVPASPQHSAEKPLGS
jgi:lysophospholipase L1-like esterase